VAIGTFVTATALGGGSNSSEFSQAVPIVEPPSFAIGDVSVTEGNAGTVAATFTVYRNGNTGGASSVLYSTADGTAVAPDDYFSVPTTQLSFAADETSKTITVLVRGDTTFEPNETFFVNLSSPVNATIGDPQGKGTITNDDADAAPPVVLGSEFQLIGSLPTPYEARFTLSEPVVGPPGGVPLLIRRIDNGQLVTTVFANIENGTLLRGEFTQVLPDGNYRATLPSGAVTDLAGNLLLSDVDLPFFVLLADANQDRHVNTIDFTMLAMNFNQTSKTFTQGDFSYDSKVNALDFNALATKFGSYLAPPIAPADAVFSATQASIQGLDATGTPLFAAVPIESGDQQTDLDRDEPDSLMAALCPNSSHSAARAWGKI
jgi:hypothetical protein